MNQEEPLKYIDDLGPFLVDDIDVTTAVKGKLKNVIELIAQQENISLIEANEKLKSSPIYSFLVDDYTESLFTPTEEIYDALTSMNNRMQR